MQRGVGGLQRGGHGYAHGGDSAERDGELYRADCHRGRCWRDWAGEGADGVCGGRAGHVPCFRGALKGLKESVMDMSLLLMQRRADRGGCGG